VKVGDSAVEVQRKLGPPKRQDATLFDQNCNGQHEIYQYAPRTPGSLAQTIYLCNDRVVDIKHDPFASAAAPNGTGESVKTGDTRVEVETKLGPPKSKDRTYSGQNCSGRQDVYYYPAPSQGRLAQTIIFCDNRVVDIQSTLLSGR
jgi:hypothetical protein